jgi:hypothetical protein
MPSPEAVVLREEEREVALAEALAVHALAADPGYREQLAELVTAVGTGELDEEQAATLEGLLELALQSGRIRSVYGPGGEQAALRTYRRLPGGKALTASAREVSGALAALAGAELRSLAIEAVGPGAYALKLTTATAELSVRLDRQGARLASVAV